MFWLRRRKDLEGVVLTPPVGTRASCLNGCPLEGILVFGFFFCAPGIRNAKKIGRRGALKFRRGRWGCLSRGAVCKTEAPSVFKALRERCSARFCSRRRRHMLERREAPFRCSLAAHPRNRSYSLRLQFLLFSSSNSLVVFLAHFVFASSIAFLTLLVNFFTFLPYGLFITLFGSKNKQLNKHRSKKVL